MNDDHGGRFDWRPGAETRLHEPRYLPVRRSWIFGGLLATLVLLGTCGVEEPRGSAGPFGGFSTSYLDDELARVALDIRGTRESMLDGTDGALARLRDAQQAVEDLRTIYLPLLDAREVVTNAHRLHMMGRNGEAQARLDSVRERILRVSRQANEPLLGELKRMESLVAAAQVEIQADSPTTRSSLDELVVEMEDFVTKAGYFIEH